MDDYRNCAFGKIIEQIARELRKDKNDAHGEKKADRDFKMACRAGDRKELASELLFKLEMLQY